MATTKKQTKVKVKDLPANKAGSVNGGRITKNENLTLLRIGASR